MIDWLGIIVFLVASAGHAVLIFRSHNWWYGTGLSRRTIDVIKQGHGVVMLAGLVGLWHFRPQPNHDPWNIFPSPIEMVFILYYLVCWLALLYFLGLTIWRLVRPKPGVLESNHTRTINVAKELGYLPIGRSKHTRLARLPGNEVFQVDLNEKTLRLARLPAAWDGLSILHISDVHFIGTPDRDYFRYVMDQCAAWAPDLVAFTGDTVDSDTHHRWIVPLFGRLKWNCAAFAILGNHDTYFDMPVLRRRFGRVGMQVLGNRFTQIEVRGEPMVVIGHEGPWVEPAPDLSECPTGPFRLCLSHTPDNIAWARRHAIDLMLAGHVHGGQIRFPILGSLLVPSKYGRRFDCGTFDLPPTVMHVSRGLGAEHPVRYRCRPEVTKLILRRHLV